MNDTAVAGFMGGSLGRGCIEMFNAKLPTRQGKHSDYKDSCNQVVSPSL